MDTFFAVDVVNSKVRIKPLRVVTVRAHFEAPNCGNILMFN